MSMKLLALGRKSFSRESRIPICLRWFHYLNFSREDRSLSLKEKKFRSNLRYQFVASEEVVNQEESIQGQVWRLLFFKKNFVILIFMRMTVPTRKAICLRTEASSSSKRVFKGFYWLRQGSESNLRSIEPEERPIHSGWAVPRFVSQLLIVLVFKEINWVSEGNELDHAPVFEVSVS